MMQEMGGMERIVSVEGLCEEEESSSVEEGNAVDG